MSFIVKTLLITVFFTIFISSSPASKSSIDLKTQNYVVDQDLEVLPNTVSSYLENQNNETVKIWVFFRDKGFTEKSGFSKIASSVQLSEKVLKRRKKVNLDQVLFVDLPVHTDYVKQIEQIGTTHRRSSRWLNAASFEVTLSSLDEIKNLNFVKSIKPMVGFKRNESEISTSEEIQQDKNYQSPFSADALSYGPSTDQLQQINVPAAHAKGYTGAGVTLCITDSGFRTAHSAFAAHYAAGRVIAEYDFIFNDSNTSNEAGDVANQWNHGTSTWSAAAGELSGVIYGPAYRANILLAKTEDERSETPVEEDNWVAALEWADSLGVDVISTSLGYSDWYSYLQYDGNTATITLAANTCASLGIVLCNSMGNDGPSGTSLSPPADAFDIIAVGAVNVDGDIASFSSRGPTIDGRIKPEVCARGVSTYLASAYGLNNFTNSNGTSFSTPLVAGATCLLIEARPNFSPLHIRQALMETADNADSPDNVYGSGIIDIDAALGWGAGISADIQVANAPITVNFSGSSPLTVASWFWDFGDGTTSTVQNPSHTYSETGSYDVSLTVDTDAGIITNNQTSFIAALGDTMIFVEDSVYAGSQAVFSVSLTNSQPLSEIHVPFKFFDYPKLSFDSVTLGLRTSYFDELSAISIDNWNKRFTFKLKADNGNGTPDLPSGSGEIMQIHFTVDEWQLGGQDFLIDSITTPFSIELSSPNFTYAPLFQNGSLKTIAVMRGDISHDFVIDISDLVGLVDFMFTGGPAPLSNQMADMADDKVIDISDLVYLVDFMFNDGPPPVSP